MVFWREDVWHRTQDMALDRVGFIADVLRFPLADAPRLSPAQAWERAASCTDLEDISLLPLRGFVVLRKVPGGPLW